MQEQREELQAKGTYSEFKEQLDIEIKKSVESFVKIGYLLKIARDTEILYESGYPSMVEFAKGEYNLSKDQVSRFIAINDKFSVDGYSDKLQEKYEGYGVAKLAEMLTLPDVVVDIIEPEMTRAEIQEIKREVKEEQTISDIEVMLEEKDAKLEDMNMIQKFMYQYFYEKRMDFIQMAAVINGELGSTEQEIEKTLQVLAPSGIATKKVRIAGIGKMFLSIKGKDNNLELVNVRANEMESISWIMFLDDIAQLYEFGASKNDWERYYHEPFEQKEEVAPVQPQTICKENEMGTEQSKTENNNIVNNEQIPGQMNVDDYPELTPKSENNVDNSQSKSEEFVEKTESEVEFTDNFENVEENEQIIDVEAREIIEKTECEDRFEDAQKVNVTVGEVLNTAINVFTEDCIEIAKNNWSEIQVKMLQRLFECVKSGCEYKCIECVYYGRPADAPETIEAGCMWKPSEDNGWDLPCEEH